MTSEFSNIQVKLEDLPDYNQVNFQSVSNRLRHKHLVLISLIFLAFVIGFSLYSYYESMDNNLLIVAAIVTVLFILIFIHIIVKQAYYGYAVREKDIIYRRGYIWTRTTIIPFSRIQHLAINRNLLDKFFRLSSLKIYTAGGNKSDINIPGLTPDLAEQLKDLISQKVSDYVA